MQKYQDMRHFSLEHGAMTQRVREEYQLRFSSPGALHFPFQLGEWPAFVMLHRELGALISRLYRRNNELEKLCQLIPEDAVDQFVMNMLVEEIQQSNEVENVHSTRKEIRDAVDAQRSRRRGVRFFDMVNKYNMLVQGQTIELSHSSDVRRLYDEFLLEEVVREEPENAPDGTIFRNSPTGVYDSRDMLIHEGLFPESRIIETIEQGLSILRDETLDPLIRAAVFHYLFAYVHPFYDGNGRMTRFVSSYLLSRDFNTAACLRISFVIKENKSLYYRLFRNANEKRSMGEITEFVLGFLQLFEKALQDTFQSLQEKYSHYVRYQILLDRALENLEKPLDVRFHAVCKRMLIVELFGSEQFDLQTLSDAVECNPKTMRKVLEQCKPFVYHSGGRPYYWHIDLEQLERLDEG